MAHIISQGFPNISVGKESTCNAGDSSSIPESGRSAGERIGYPLQYSWNSLVTQLEKNLPAMRETWVRPRGWEDPLEKGKAIHSRILAWRIPWSRWPWGIVHGVTKSRTRLSDFTSLSNMKKSVLEIFISPVKNQICLPQNVIDPLNYAILPPFFKYKSYSKSFLQTE